MKLSFFDLFPTPKLIAVPHQGVDIGDTAVRFVELGIANGRHQLLGYGSYPLVSGVIQDGVIVQPEPVIKALSELRDKHGLRLVRASLPEERAYLFKTEVPLAAVADLKTNIEFKIEENVPLSPKEALFGFEVISDDHKKVDHLDIVVSVLPQEVVTDYLTIFHQAGIEPVSFQIESQAITKAVIAQADPHNYLLLNVSQTKVGIYVVSGRVVHFASTLALRAPADLKNNLPTEIVKVKNYWVSHQTLDSNQDTKISALIISGLGSIDNELKQYLARESGLPVKMANAWQNVISVEEKIPEMTFAESLEYVGAIGLALAD